MSMNVIVQEMEVEIRKKQEENERLSQYGELLSKNLRKQEETNDEV